MENKIKELQKKLPEGVDSFISLDEKTVLYLTGFTMNDGALFVTRDDAVLFVDFRYIEAANEEAKNCRVVMPEKNFYESIREIMAERGAKTIGFEENKTTVALLERQQKLLPDAEFVKCGGVITKMAEIKSEYELELIATAESIGDAALADVLPRITHGMTEIEVALELEFAMRKRGAQGLSFPTICVSGTASSRPHGEPRNVKLERGFLTMDFGAKYQGYCSDMTRTIVIGKADEDIKKLYNTVLTAQKAALDFLREGVTGRDADKVARDIIDAVPEYKNCFGHSLGHGVGRFIHESPRLARIGEKELVRGNVVTVEPGIYLAGKYGCRIEDMVAITENGIRNFTKSNKELIEIY